MINISKIYTERKINGTELENKVYDTLEKLNIKYERIDNDEVNTMEECIAINDTLNTEIRKSILLCNSKKTTFFLVVLPANKSLDTNLLAKKIGINKLSFASDDKMFELLGTTPGSLSIMGIIKDIDDYVQVILDKEIINSEYFGCNDTKNTTHLKIKTNDLINKFLPYTKHKPLIIDL